MKPNDIPATYNGDWLERLDGRTAIAKAISQRLRALETDLGGHDALSYQQRSLVKRAVWMEAIIEQQESALSRGEAVDQGKLTQAVNSLMGLLKTLGLERIARDVPTLNEYLKQKTQRATQ